MRLSHPNSLRLLIQNHREASVLSPLAHTPQYELFLSSWNPTIFGGEEIFSEEATSAFKLVFMRVLYHLERLVFVEGERAENPEKNPWSKVRNNNKLIGGRHALSSTRNPCSPRRSSDIIWIPSLPYASSSEDVHQCWSQNTLQGLRSLMCRNHCPSKRHIFPRIWFSTALLTVRSTEYMMES